MAAELKVDTDATAAVRFHLVNENELMEFIDSADSENTKKQIKYGLSVFNDFCQRAKMDYETIDNKSLDFLLSQFYAGARNQKGELYSKKSMQSIRYGLQRHFLTERNVDIVKGNEFPLSKKAFKALLGKLKKAGKASVKRHLPITEADMALIQSSLDVSTAKGLQQKVFIDAMIYFANRGMENLRNMRPDDFILHPGSETRREFFSLRDMSTKNHVDDDEESQGGRMYRMPGNPRCPVATLKKYKAKLNPNCEWMWQRPKQKVCQEDDVWYDNSPLGKDTLSNMTKKVCEAAGCSKPYTNHCLRATSVTLLDHAGYASRDIMTVSGHSSETSIKYYARTSEMQKERMSDTISSTLNQHDEDAPATAAAAEDVAADPLTDSQVERILDDIAQNPSVLQDISNSSTANPPGANPVSTSPTTGYSQSLNMVTSNHHQGQNATYHFHGCVVNIYNK